MSESDSESPLFEAPRDLEAEIVDLPGNPLVIFSWSRSARPERAREAPRLTPAEAEVFGAILEGLSNAAIAERRGTSVHTVANQVAALLRKLQVGSRYELIARFGSAAGGEGHGR